MNKSLVFIATIATFVFFSLYFSKDSYALDDQCSQIPCICEGSCINIDPCMYANPPASCRNVGDGRAAYVCPTGYHQTCTTPEKYECLQTKNTNNYTCTDAPYVDEYNTDRRYSDTCTQYQSYCQTNCSCCAIGSSRVCTPGGTYDLPALNANGSCNNFDTKLFSYLNTNYKVPQDCEHVYIDGVYMWDKCYIYLTRCQTQNCACTASCTDVAPSKPVLVTPANNATLSATSVTLKWSWPAGSIWGTNCSGATNRFKVYAWENGKAEVLKATYQPGVLQYVFPVSGGKTYNWKVVATNGASETISDVRQFTVTTPAIPSWWQTKDGDITTPNDISSEIYTGYLLDVAGNGGYPGLPVYGGSLSKGQGNISIKQWESNASISSSRNFNYSYFSNLIPSGTTLNNISKLATGNTEVYTDGYAWYKASGDVNISSNIDFGGRKVILFIENGSLNVDAKINLNDGAGFFAVFAAKDINIGSTVSGSPAIEGLYLADGDFVIDAASTQFHARGSITTFGTITIQRSLANNSTGPSELFEFAPDQLLMFPDKLGYRRQRWSEVAP